MTNDVRMEYEKLDGNVITLKSVFSKDRKAIIQPTFDTVSRWYLGVDRLSTDDTKGLRFWVDPLESKLTITHNMTFDLTYASSGGKKVYTSEVDAKNWEWVKHSSCIAPSFELCQMTKNALFYVDNEEREAQKTLDSDSLLLTALKLVNEDRDDLLKGRARLLGYGMEGDSPTVIRHALNKLAKDPKTVQSLIDAYKSNALGINLLFLTAVDKGVVTMKKGMFFYGDTPLGVTEEDAVNSLSSSENSEIVKVIEKAIINQKKIDSAPPKVENGSNTSDDNPKDELPDVEKETSKKNKSNQTK